jgi:hypothetical protein
LKAGINTDLKDLFINWSGHSNGINSHTRLTNKNENAQKQDPGIRKQK